MRELLASHCLHCNYLRSRYPSSGASLTFSSLLFFFGIAGDSSSLLSGSRSNSSSSTCTSWSLFAFEVCSVPRSKREYLAHVGKILYMSWQSIIITVHLNIMRHKPCQLLYFIFRQVQNLAGARHMFSQFCGPQVFSGLAALLFFVKSLITSVNLMQTVLFGMANRYLLPAGTLLAVLVSHSTI